MFNAMMILMTAVIKLKRWRNIRDLFWISSNFYFMQLTMLLILIGCTQMNYAAAITSIPNITDSKPQPAIKTISSNTSSYLNDTNAYHRNDMKIEQNRIHNTNENDVKHKIDEEILITNNSMNAATAMNAMNWDDDVDRFSEELDEFDPFEDFFSGKMKFGTKNSTVITAQIGGNAYLPCIVHNIGDSVVSWIRRNEYRLLTVSTITYIRDERFSVTHRKHSEDWTLQIKYAKLEDAGWYECQVSVHPPTSIFVLLHVIEAHAEIVGPHIRYLTPGSMLKLLCRIVQNTEISAFMFWYHNNRMINYDIDRGINVSTEAEYHHSELIIEHTKIEHSGNYTCVPSNAHPAYVVIHIFKGDQQAAMYHEDWSSSGFSPMFYRNFLSAIL